MASSRRGSLFGNGAWALKFLTKTMVSNPPMNARQPNCKQSHLKGYPCGCCTGRILKARSAKFIAHAQRQTQNMILKLDFTQMGSSTRNGRRKWPKMMSMSRDHHEPFSRMRYQKFSSGMLPFQTTKYCANPK